MHPAQRLSIQTHGMWRIDTCSEPATRDEDCFEVRSLSGVIRVALADGAGGMTGGREAAAHAVRVAIASPPSPTIAASIDRALVDRGQTTLVSLELDFHASRVHGLSVGDSRAWARCRGVWVELTEAQSRKPLLGDGNARVVAFDAHDVDVICVASDGLASEREMHWITSMIDGAARGDTGLFAKLIDPLRRPNGRLVDDVSVVLLRHREHG